MAEEKMKMSLLMFLLVVLVAIQLTKVLIFNKPEWFGKVF